MATQYIHRVLIICPLARRAAFNTWIKANLDLIGGDWFDVGLSASGNTPAQGFWAFAALTNSELKQLMQRLCTLASITPDANWDTFTRQQKKQWLLDQRAPIRTATGIRILPMDNDGVWDDPLTELAAAGLQVIQPAL